MDVNTQVDNFDAVIASHGEWLARQDLGLPSGNHPNAPSPLTPDEFDEGPKEAPRDPQDVDLFKKVAGTGSTPIRA